MLRRSVVMFGLAGLALLAVLALPQAAWAGGVVVSLDAAPVDVQAGVPFTVGFVIRSMHDGSEQSGLEPTVVARLVAGKQEVQVVARQTGALGHYAATLTLPEAGEWNWEINPFGSGENDYPSSRLSPLTVGALAATADKPLTMVPPPAPVMWLALLVAACAAIALLHMRWRAVRP